MATTPEIRSMGSGIRWLLIAKMPTVRMTPCKNHEIGNSRIIIRASWDDFIFLPASIIEPHAAICLQMPQRSAAFAPWRFMGRFCASIPPEQEIKYGLLRNDSAMSSGLGPPAPGRFMTWRKNGGVKHFAPRDPGGERTKKRVRLDYG